MLSSCGITTDADKQELQKHGTSSFPIACYHDDLSRNGVPWHWHEELEAAILTEGEAIVTIGAETYTIGKGDGFFANSGVLHGCLSGKKECCRFHSLVFHPRLVGGSLESVFYQKYLLPILENQALLSLHLRASIPWQAAALGAIEKAWQACVQEPEYYEFQVRNGLSELVAAIYAHIPAAAVSPDTKALRDGERIKHMLQFIGDAYAEEIDTAAIARSAAISESECLRCFRSTIGTTPISYLREYRIERAAQLLAGSRERIADVAAQCGFQDVSYFTKTFRQMRGITPREYRKRQQGGIL